MTPRLLISPWALAFEAQTLEGVWLCLDKERKQLRQIDRVLAVVVVGRAADPSGPTRGGDGFAFQICLRQCGIAGIAG